MLCYLWGSPDRAEQLGAVADCSSSVTQVGGKLGRLSEVVLLVLRWLVINA